MPCTLKVRAERVWQGRRKPSILPSILPSNIHGKIYTFRGTQNPYLTRPLSENPRPARPNFQKGCPKSLPYADIFIKPLPYTAAARPNFQKELKILPLRGHVARPLAKVSQALAKASQDNPRRAPILTLREHFHIIGHKKMWCSGHKKCGALATKKMWCSGHKKCCVR